MATKEERRRRELQRLQKAIERQKEESAQSESEVEQPQTPESEPASETQGPTAPREVGDSDDLWDAFSAADLDGKEALFREIVASGDMEPDVATDMLGEIRALLDKSDPQDRARYADLVGVLRDQASDAYHWGAHFYHRNLISDAIAAGQWEDIPQLLEPFVEKPAANLDTFSEVIDELTYHGRLQILIPAMTRAWPKVRDSDEVLGWAIQEFAERLMRLHLFRYLETADDPRADDPDLLERTDPYGEWQADWLEQAIARLTAPRPSEWAIADFGPAVDADRWRDNLGSLLFEFVADRRRAGVPYSRGDTARSKLVDILMRQLALPTKTLEVGSGGQAGGKRRGRRDLTVPAPVPLVPRNQLLDEALVDLFPFFGARPYHAAALMELLPSYLHFLARLGLIHPMQMDAALANLRPLSAPALRMIEGYGGDPRALEAVKTAWSDEVLTALKEDPALAEARGTSPEPLPEPEKPEPHRGAALTYTFKVRYLRDPDVWRTIEIAANQTLHRLHHAILNAVDFDRDHLYSFYMSNRAWDEATEYNSPYTDGPSAGGVKIGELDLRMKQRFLYLYDYGDEHRFEVQLIDVNPEAPKGESSPRVLERHGEDPEQYGW